MLWHFIYLCGGLRGVGTGQAGDWVRTAKGDGLAGGWDFQSWRGENGMAERGWIWLECFAFWFGLCRGILLSELGLTENYLIGWSG